MFENQSDAEEGAAVLVAAGQALQALCQELNLDEGSAAEALNDFITIRGNYSLEVRGGRWGRPDDPPRAPPRPAPTPAYGAVGAFICHRARGSALGGLRGVQTRTGGCRSAGPPIMCMLCVAGNGSPERRAACPSSRVTQGSPDGGQQDEKYRRSIQCHMLAGTALKSIETNGVRLGTRPTGGTKAPPQPRELSARCPGSQV